MPPMSPPPPLANPVSYHGVEWHSSISLGLSNLLHDRARRDNVDENIAVPRWAVFLVVCLPLSLFFLGVAVYYLYHNRRSGMDRLATPVELQDIRLQDLESDSQRTSPLGPRKPERYWPNVFPGSPGSEVTVFPGFGAERAPQQPRTAFDKSLPNAPAGSVSGEGDDWETVAPMTRDSTFSNAFAQHRIDQERSENERRDRRRRESNERSLMEALKRTNEHKKYQNRGNPYELSPCPSDHSARSGRSDRGGDNDNENNNKNKNSGPTSPLAEMSPHVNDGYALYRRYRLKYGDADNDTDIILASDSNTLGPPTTVTTSNAGSGSNNNSKNVKGGPYATGSGGGTALSSRDRRRQELIGGSDNNDAEDRFLQRDGGGGGYLRAPQPAHLASRRRFVAPAASGTQFPSDESEMDNFTEAVITDDPFVAAGARRKK